MHSIRIPAPAPSPAFALLLHLILISVSRSEASCESSSLHFPTHTQNTRPIFVGIEMKVTPGPMRLRRRRGGGRLHFTVHLACVLVFVSWSVFFFVFFCKWQMQICIIRWTSATADAAWIALAITKTKGVKWRGC